MVHDYGLIAGTYCFEVKLDADQFLAFPLHMLVTGCIINQSLAIARLSGSQCV